MYVSLECRKEKEGKERRERKEGRAGGQEEGKVGGERAAREGQTQKMHACSPFREQSF